MIKYYQLSFTLRASVTKTFRKRGIRMNKQQLAAKIWESANKMRSKIEANEYKDYILGFIFYKFLSEQEERFLLSSDFQPEDIKEYVNEDDPDTVEMVLTKICFLPGWPWAPILPSTMYVRHSALLPG